MLRALSNRETGLGPSSSSDLRFTLSSSTAALHRLRLERVLEGHDGCVNTVHFNPQGNLLLSGSDDLSVVIWDWASGRRRFSFEPGHRNNIFQARVMPHTSDKTIISCAADGQVRVSQLGEGGAVVKRKLAQHQGRAHKLAIVPDQPHCFLSCGEDGDVRLFDLREDEPGSASSMRMSVKTGSPGERGRRMPLDLNTIHINPCRPWMFAVGGDDQFVRVYDLRGLRSRVQDAVRRLEVPNAADSGTAATRGAATVRGTAAARGAATARGTATARGAASRPTYVVCSEPMVQLAPEHLHSRQHSGRHITCVMYSRTGELLVTYHQEDMYLLEPWGQQQPTAEGRGRGGDDDGGRAGSWGQDLQGAGGPSCGGEGTAGGEELKAPRGCSVGDSGTASSSARSSSSGGGGSDGGGGGGGGGRAGHAIMQFSGHCNVQTVKGCSFLGERDEYVVSGSDCGHVFIWSKADGKLLQMVKGDPHVVNCLEPHPWQPLVLATSGIANDVKIWAPTADDIRPPDPVYVEEITSKNAALLGNRGRSSRVTLSPSIVLQMDLQELLSRRTAVARRRRDEDDGPAADGEPGEAAARQQRPRPLHEEERPPLTIRDTLSLLRMLYEGERESEEEEEDEDEEEEPNTSGVGESDEGGTSAGESGGQGGSGGLQEGGRRGRS